LNARVANENYVEQAARLGRENRTMTEAREPSLFARIPLQVVTVLWG